MDIYGFTHYYNKISAQCELNIEDFIRCNGTYSAVLEKDGIRLHLALEESETGKIEEIRLLIPKADESGVKFAVTETAKDIFCEELRSILVAYTDFNSEEADGTIKEMSLDKLSSFSTEGELTLSKRDWHMVYYSTEIASVFMIFNICLHPVEKTEKPESKADFGNTAFTRPEPST